MKEIKLTLELYKTENYYGCWLSNNAGGSGICVESSIKHEFCEELMPHIEDYLYRIDDNEEEARQFGQHKDYISLIERLCNKMKRELWDVIEAHKDDERCDCPRQFAEVSFEHKHLCEVDLGGYTYFVDAVKLEQWPYGSLHLTIKSNRQWYTVDEVGEVAGVLHAVRNTFDIEKSE